MGDIHFRDGLCCYARPAAELLEFRQSAVENDKDEHDQHKGG
jgi:hypothetical protein